MANRTAALEAPGSIRRSTSPLAKQTTLNGATGGLDSGSFALRRGLASVSGGGGAVVSGSGDAGRDVDGSSMAGRDRSTGKASGPRRITQTSTPI
jgi:hypothetical protein